MKTKFKSLLAIAIAILLVLACSLPSQLISRLKPTVTASPTNTPTLTATPTQTLHPTEISTLTATSTATPIPLTILPQDDGKTLIVDPAYGYQFTLPKGWGAVSFAGKEQEAALKEAYEIYPGLETFDSLLGLKTNTSSRVIAIDVAHSNWPGDNIRLIVSAETDWKFSLERWLESYTNTFKNTGIYGNDRTIIKKGITTNPNGMQLAYFEFKGSLNQGKIKVHTYLIFCYLDAVRITFSISIDDPLNSYAQQDIPVIQNSIQQAAP